MDANWKQDQPGYALAALACICLTVVLLAPVACTMSRQAVIAEAIKNGADPIAAKCAIEGDTTREPVCMAYTLREKR